MKRFFRKGGAFEFLRILNFQRILNFLIIPIIPSILIILSSEP